MSSVRAKQKLVVVGNGMAGIRTLEYLLQYVPDRYEITVFGAEPFGNYNRIMLSPVLAGEMTFNEIVSHDFDWYERHNISLHAGVKVIDIDRRRRVAIAEDGTRAEYDRLLLATGSRPFILPIPGASFDGVLAYRDFFDVDKMMEAARSYRKAVVIGGGLLGLEAANGLLKQGMDVTVVHNMPYIMERQLDETAAGYLQSALEKRGIRFRVSHHTAGLLAHGDFIDGEHNKKPRVRAVRFNDGSEIEADLVVMAVGIRPNIELAKQAGLHCERGIVVDDTLQTYDPNIYAVGECAQHRGIAYGLVAPLYDQAKVCANHLAGQGYLGYKGSLLSTRLKVTGIEMFSAGDFIGGDDTESLVYQDPGAGIYKKLVLRNGVLTGAILYGEAGDGAWCFDKLQAGESVEPIRDRLIFGRAYVESTTSVLAA